MAAGLHDQALDGLCRAGLTDTPALRALAERLAAAAAELADCGVSAADAGAYAARLIGRAEAAERERAAAELPAADAVLALGCAAGSAAAIRRFEDRYFGGIAPALARMGLGAADVDELRQRVRERLFVAAPGAEPRVLAAVGGGDLGAFVRVTAVRMALNLRRDGRRLQPEPGEVIEALAPADDPALAGLPAADRERVRRAFERAVAALGRRERAVLRLHLLCRLGIDDIARSYGVHRATAARWLARVRSALARDTRRLLRAELGGDSVDGLLLAAQSQLDISFERLLASDQRGSTGSSTGSPSQ